MLPKKKYSFCFYCVSDGRDKRLSKGQTPGTDYFVVKVQVPDRRSSNQVRSGYLDHLHGAIQHASIPEWFRNEQEVCPSKRHRSQIALE